MDIETGDDGAKVFDQGKVIEYPTRVPKAVPRGRVLVHNSVRPAARQGLRGFRFWLQAPDPMKLTVCNCKWAEGLGQHYRVKRQATATRAPR
jgi:hypothetical protein